MGGSSGVGAEGGSEIRHPHAPQYGDDEIETGSAHLRRRTGAGLAGILAEGLVPHPMALVLDPPVAADLAGKRVHTGAGGRLAGDVVRDLARVLRDNASCAHHDALPLDAADLGEVRPGLANLPAAAEIGIEGWVGERPEQPHLQPAMLALRCTLGQGADLPAACRQISPQPCRGQRWPPPVQARRLPEGKRPPRPAL